MVKKFVTITSLIALTLSLFSIQPDVSHAAPITDANSSIFGPNVYVFDPSMPASDIQNAADTIFAAQEKSEFGSGRYALLFKPGTYNANVRVGFYTQVAGLGRNPDDVTINGGVNADAKWDNGNATRNFWRSVENLAVNPLDLTKTPAVPKDAQWAVSQAAPMRRVHIKGNLLLFDFDANWNAGWASGGYIADSVVDGKITPASQQQFLSRNNQYGQWTNGVWNMVFVGDANPPAGTFPKEPYTVVDKTPVIKEKPYLYVNGSGDFEVFVPSLQTDKKNVSWAGGSTPGTSLPISTFYVAKPDVSSAADINAALGQGKNVIFTPGYYHLDDTIRVTKPDTVVMGLGYASLVPEQGKPAMTVADVDGVNISSLLFLAGQQKSSTLLEVGTAGSSKDHTGNPILLSDLFFGVGGMVAGTADVGLQINSKNVIGDHFWIWRADHGAGASWNTNVSKNGLVVDGDDATIYGLFNEHHEEYQTVWNGNGGRLYFYQSEIPYDPPSQGVWMSHNGTVNGYASYKVADSVTSHEAWGLGVYSFFRDAPVKLESAIEVPNVSGVKIHHATTIWLSGKDGSEITHVINGAGGRVYANSPSDAMRQTISEYVGGDTQAPSVPGGLQAIAVSDKRVDLSWTASNDNVGVESYDIYRNGTKVGSTFVTSYSDTGLKANTTYSYTVAARDSAGNQSAQSDPAAATTLKEYISYNQIGWTASASDGSNPGNMLDGNMSTKWTTGKPMVPGQYFTVDMKSAKRFSRVVLRLNQGDNDYARGYEVYVSNDGTDWGNPIASGAGTSSVITVDLANPQTARYIKVVQTGRASAWWAVSEFGVYTDTEKSLDRNGWTAVTNPNTNNTSVLFDGSMSTRWSSGTSMVPGQSITIDMQKVQIFNKIVMDSTGSNNDYARSYKIYVSNDGQSWGELIVTETATGPFIVSDFANQTARYIKIEQTGTNSSWWSIYELYVYKDGSTPVQVSNIEVSGANGANSITTKGGTLQMNAIVTPAYADDVTLTWAVYNADGSPTDKATITANGLLAAVKSGSVKVVATANDGSGITGSATITISGQQPVVGIKVSGANGATAITSKGGTLQMMAEVLPADADDKTVTWSVTNADGSPTDNATISADGLLAALNDGQVKVVATANDGSGVSGSVLISISGQNKPVSSIKIIAEGGADKIRTKGGTLQLYAEILPADARNLTVIWSVTDPDGSPTDKAEISSTGLLRALKNGAVKITATTADGSGVKGEIKIVLNGQQGKD
ncbi:fibronectin type III domain-containing protein [Cohnella pontilimi]|uniref:Fibronectin type III domain-containing protein n=1 Tax=Cohnella pontilimi TaxID=2564100 RepID=A0A4U0FA93_9BACL|nr:discoidin domain-containing protein [Cohnella pontilimi]TJY41550.1 fibronectin type III domain-containing protein [Cohnella pontilimi]